MSETMRDDDNAMNKFNPGVAGPEMSVPGTVRYTGETAADYTHGTEDIGWLVIDPEPSIACKQTRTMGDKTIDFCTDSLPTSISGRPLHPHRNIDYGFEDKAARLRSRGLLYVGSGGSPVAVAAASRAELVVGKIAAIAAVLIILFRLVVRR